MGRRARAYRGARATAVAAALVVLFLAAPSAQADEHAQDVADLAREGERALAAFSCAILAQHGAGIVGSADADGPAMEVVRALSAQGRAAARAAGEAYRSLATRQATALFGGHAALLQDVELDFFAGYYFAQAIADTNMRLAPHAAVEPGGAESLEAAADRLSAAARRAYEAECPPRP